MTVAINPCYPPDFTPIIHAPHANAPHDVAIIVGAGRPEGRYLAMVATEAGVLIHAEVDRIGASTFVAEAMLRISARWPHTRIHAMLDLGPVGTGVIVPCPPPPPPLQLVREGIKRVFTAIEHSHTPP